MKLTRARLRRGGRALMGMLGWVMMGLAIWHYTIFLPDRFWGGIVGAFIGSLLGAVIFGLLDLQHQSLRTADPRREGDRHRGRALCGSRGAHRHRHRVSRGHAPRTLSRARAPRHRLAAPEVLSLAPRSLRACSPTGSTSRTARPSTCGDFSASSASAVRWPRCSSAAASQSPRWLVSSSTAAPSIPPRPSQGIEDAAAADPAARRRRRAQITVHGDYDVDGICSTAILVRVAAQARRGRRLLSPRPRRRRLWPLAPRPSSASPRAARAC